MRWVLVFIILEVVCGWASFGGGGTKPKKAEDDGHTSYYTVLVVPSTASQQSIKIAFRALSKKYHPDVNPSPDADRKFAAITEAYEVLSDSNNRKTYDRYGLEGLKREEER